MKAHEIMDCFHTLLEEVRRGIFITVDSSGYPQARWMVACTLNERPDSIYAVSVDSSAKIQDMAANKKVAWSFQLPSLNQIVYIQGEASVLDNPQLKAEVIESLGPNLAHFWRVRPEHGHLVVVETVIEKIRLEKPMSAGSGTGDPS
jgi:general stress protein 26